MNFISNTIKIMYVNLGYLPNYPYHMISDKEMIDAFIKENGYFDAMYPCPGDSVKSEYKKLRDCIEAILADYLEDNIQTIPEWVLSYMLGNTITFNSDCEDIEYLHELLHSEPQVSDDLFDEELARACLAVSTEWIKKLPPSAVQRMPTMFGEPHVIKSARLAASDILTS